MSIPCPPDTFVYSVQPGDTLYRLAQRFNITVAAILRANPGVDPNRLQVNQRLCIPRGLTVCPPNSQTYTIRSGDTLYNLAQRFNTTVEAIRRANPGIDPNRLQIGMQICIPGSGETCPSGSERYLIQGGDTFYILAVRLNTTIATLIELNPGVDPTRLQIGQPICVPRPLLLYANRTYRVSFLFPANWQPINDERYEGPDGFFQIAAIASPEAIEVVCQSEAFHVLRPYGSAPTIERLIVQNQEACLILPSADQPVDMRHQAALIVRYPKPVQIGNQFYNYFILYADQMHIQAMANSLEFFPDLARIGSSGTFLTVIKKESGSVALKSKTQS